MSVDPGEGYRLLERGETIVATDEFWDCDRWTITDLPGDDVVDGLYRRCKVVDSINRIRTAMQNHPNWADILFGELTEPLRTDLKLVLEHYLGEKA